MKSNIYLVLIISHALFHVLTFNIFNNDSPASSRGNRRAKVLVHYLVFLFVLFSFVYPGKTLSQVSQSLVLNIHTQSH